MCIAHGNAPFVLGVAAGEFDNRIAQEYGIRYVLSIITI